MLVSPISRLREKGSIVASGTIQSIRTERGFGFILPENGTREDELFFHHSAVVGSSFDLLKEGQKVTYEEGVDPRNPTRRRAVDVQPQAE